MKQAPTASTQASPMPTKIDLCRHFGFCGGCATLDVPYATEIDRKMNGLKSAFQRSALKGDFEWLPLLAAAQPLHYRTALKVPFGFSSGHLLAGFFARGSHSIVNLEECRIHVPVLTEILVEARELALRWKVSIYDERSHHGILRALLARVGTGTDEVLAGLVVRHRGTHRVRGMAKDLFDRFEQKGLVGVCENVHPERTNYMIGRNTYALFGRSMLREKLEDHDVRTSLTTFAQGNAAQAEVLYQRVVELLEPLAGKTVVEAFAGFGPIALRLAWRGARVIAVEQNPVAVHDGKRIARDLGLGEKIGFEEADADHALPAILRARFDAVLNRSSVDVALVDPPRKGLGSMVRDALARFGPATVLYVSCNPETLVRDLESIVPAYKVDFVQPLDMYPRTKHLEVIARLHRQSH